MHTIQGKSIGINDVMLDTYSRCVLEDGAQLTVEAGTNGYRGKGREAGGRTYIRLASGFGDFLFRPVKNSKGRIIGVEICGCGDAELDALVKALSFALKALEDGRDEVDD
ncbi:MAG: hypothetical protein IJK06_06600 [Clostridia bacterium]|nr:hypothetical protein [Clostridia bacterium]